MAKSAREPLWTVGVPRKWPINGRPMDVGIGMDATSLAYFTRFAVVGCSTLARRTEVSDLLTC